MDRPGKAVGSERRDATRVRLRVEVGYEDAQGQLFLRSRDLSENSIWLDAADPPPLGGEARLTLEVPEIDELLRLRGDVVRRSPEAPSGFAIRFDPEASSPGAREALRRFVDAQQIRSV